jgi:signal transduction histidine kinase
MNSNLNIYSYFKKILLLVFIFQSSIGFSNAQKADKLLMDSLYKKSKYLSYINQDSSLIILNNLISKAKINNYYNRLGKYYCLKGRILLNSDIDLEESLHYFLQAVETNKLAKSKELEIETQQNLAYYYFKNQEFDQAQEYVYYLIKNYNKSKNTELSSTALNTIGNYYLDLNYYNDGNYLDSAIYYFKESLAIAKENNYHDLEISNYINLGICFYDNEDYDKALKNYLLAESVSSITEDSLGLAVIANNIGSVYFDKGDYNKAIEYYSKSRQLFINLKNTEGNYKTLYLLSDVNAELKDYKSAYYNFMNATNIYDSTFTIEKQETINKLLVKFETEKKENEIILKNKKLALEKAKSSRRNIIIYALAIFVVLILIIGAFILQNIRNKNKLISKEVELKNQEINKILKDQEIKSYAALLEGQEKERQRIAADLHDRLGGLLSTIKSYFSVIEEKISELEEKTVKQHKTASELLNTAVEEVRYISHDLHSGVLKNFGLLLALEDLKSTLELSGSLNIDLNIDGNKQDISTIQEIEIYRIIQELFSNTMKHAKAEQVTLQIVFEEEQINIIFEDDGLGFDVGSITKGIGLKNIEARTKKLHGNLNIDSRIGRGTIVIIEIPII